MPKLILSGVRETLMWSSHPRLQSLCCSCGHIPSLGCCLLGKKFPFGVHAGRETSAIDLGSLLSPRLSLSQASSVWLFGLKSRLNELFCDTLPVYSPSPTVWLIALSPLHSRLQSFRHASLTRSKVYHLWLKQVFKHCSDILPIIFPNKHIQTFLHSSFSNS